MVEGAVAEAPAARRRVNSEIAVGDIALRAGADADEGLLTRAIRAVRAAAP